MMHSGENLAFSTFFKENRFPGHRNALRIPSKTRFYIPQATEGPRRAAENRGEPRRTAEGYKNQFHYVFLSISVA